MPTITDPEAGKVKPPAKPLRPDERQISSANCCGLCFYNIPSGTMMILLPGAVLLMIGAILMSMGEEDNSSMVGASLILIILGGALTAAGVIYWIAMWCKYKPKPAQRKGSVTPQAQVELVAVYRPTHEIPQHAPNGTYAAQSQRSLAKAQEIEGGALPS